MKKKRAFFVIKTAFILAIGFSLTACDDGKTPSSYSISASTLTSFDTLQSPYTQPAAQTVTITNTGTGAVTLTQPTAVNYLIGALSTTSLATGGATATFTVQPKGNLSVGTYKETISINGTNGTSATVNAAFAVSPPSSYSISASMLTSFGTLQSPYTQPAAQTVTITNTSGGAITLTQPTAVNYLIGALSTTSLATGGATATFTVQPRDNLSVGTYNETISINGTNGTSATVNAAFAVSAPPSYSISASTLTSFGTLQSPYTQPAAQTVTITNTGTGAVILTQPTAVNYLIGALSTTSLATGGATATFTVQPRGNLSVGTYNETIRINGTNGTSATVNASFAVSAPPSYSISTSTLTSFGTLQSPYTQPAAQTVTITSTGTGAVTLTQPTAVNYLIGTLSTTSLATGGATATFTVQPRGNLSVGTYNETIRINGTNGTSATVNASFAVSAPPSYSINASTLTSFGTLRPPYTQPAAQTVTITNTGTGAVTLTQPTAVNYLIGTLSTTSLATGGATATFTVQPRGNLSVGTYNETIRINGTNGTSATVNASFDLKVDGYVKSLLRSSKTSPTNIVFLGDGFRLEDNANGGVFDTRVTELLDYIFSIPPFAGYEDYFSAYSVSAVSADQGAKTNPSDMSPNTIFNSTYNYIGIERLLVAQNMNLVREYARFATPNPHLIIVIVNDNRYGGSGGEIATASVNSLSKEIAIHEIGHIFRLADEYVDEQYRQTVGITLASAALQPNVDITNNLSLIKWNHFIGINGYNEGAWEGGYYFATGVWRPRQYSIMSSYQLMQFNAISRETIVKAIINNAKETYSFNDFLARDILFPPPPDQKMPDVSASDNPMPVPVEIYSRSLYGNQKIRARFRGEED
ncbi:MAG: M64 family metallo-endopeptidase [Cystobacterineae bacterium]|nr:M64 family metallo-endopeptidase [Cystobacterineae bacterium]